jgi:hypothetical protein
MYALLAPASTIISSERVNILLSQDPGSYTTLCNARVQSKLYYDRRSVGQPFLTSDTHLGPTTNFTPSLFNYF